MPSRLTSERCIAIARAYCNNGFNKTNALRAVKTETGDQYYSEGYCNNGLGHKLFDNIRVKTEIDRIMAEKHVETEHNYTIAIQELRKRLAYIQSIAEGGNIQAVQVQLAILRELDDITGLHKQEIRHKDLTPQPIGEAEQQALTDLAREYKVKLAKGLRRA